MQFQHFIMASRIFIYSFLVIITFSSCSHSRHVRKNNRKVERIAERKNDGEYKNYSAEGYIKEYSEIAVREMKKYGIPASITLAQGMLESGNGNSSLARYANNHFGIKCTPDWDGRKYYKDDDRRNDCFRVYKDAEESFEDHSQFLRRKRYAQLFELKSTDYKRWAKGLKKAGYATNPKYPRLLIDLIERYELNRFDEKRARDRRERETDNDNDRERTPSAGRTYIVRKGDTLYRIATAHSITVEELMRLNKLDSTAIAVGQELAVP